MPTKIKITDTTRQALTKIRTMHAGTIIEFGNKVVEIAVDKVHRITGNLAENILVEKKAPLHVRVVTTTGYGIYEETRPGHEFIAPSIPGAIDDFSHQRKWDKT